VFSLLIQTIKAKNLRFKKYAAVFTSLVITGGVLFSPSIGAWGQNGHRIIGKVALNHLTPTAKKHVEALLSGDKLPEVTTWADEMRSNPENFWKKESSKWHYISLDKWQDFKPNHYKLPYHNEPKDIYSAILKSITVLQSSSSSASDKEFYLRFLTHLIGDLHMPLHVGRKEDRGGNRIDVKFFGEETNLHSLWDTKLIESQNLSFREFADFIETDDPKVIKKMLSVDINGWIKESYHHAQDIYDVGNGDFRWNYQYKYMPLVKQRLLQGGVRLAGVLNLIFDPAAEPGKQAIVKL